jgi:hypothetical protein
MTKKFVDLITLDRLDNLIRMQATGTPIALAERLKMSRSSLFELISFLRDGMQAPIRYCKYRISYVYDYPPKFYLGFEKDKLYSKEQCNVSGGTVRENQDSQTNDDPNKAI